MNKLTSFVFMVAFVAHCVTAEMDKQKLMEVGKQCMKETGASEDDVKVIMNKEVPESQEAKCMMACIFKKMGVMADDGKFDEEGNKKMTEEAFSDNPEKLERSKVFLEACRDRINAVVDDEKGCERAAEMHKCAVEKAKEMGYSMDDA